MMKRNYLKGIFFCVFLALGCAKVPMKSDQPNPVNSGSPTKSLNATAAVASGDIADPNIKYFGRWDVSSTTQYVSYWGGAYFRVKFTGTTVKVKVGTASNFYAKLDSGPWTNYIGASGTINLTPTPLAGGTHSLSFAQGKDYAYVFNFQGLVLDAGATTVAPTVGADLIEYIGDSITAGYTDAQAEVSDYAWVCSEALGAEHTQIAYPGITLVNGYGVNTTKIGMDVQYFKQQSIAYPSSPNWDFTRYTPKIVVINLGQNDQGTGVPDTDFQNDYYNFLFNIRAHFPNAQFFVMRPFSGAKAAPALAAVNARIAAGDTKVRYVDTNGWLTTSDYNDGLHPSVSGHIKAANLLQPIIAPYLSSGTPPQTYLDHCDASTGWASGNVLSINTSDKKEGTGALQSVGSGTSEFQKVFSTPFNSGATVVSGSVQFWYYVSDVTKLGAGDQIELGSGGASDVSEYNWSMGTLVNGWNLITKTFATASTTGGTPNLNAINWLRIYHVKTGSVTTKIDGIQILR